MANEIDLRATATRRELVVVTENALVGIPRTVTTSRRRSADWERIVVTPTPKRKIVPHIFKEDVKEKGFQKNGLRLLCSLETRRKERSNLRLHRMLIGKPKATSSE